MSFETQEKKRKNILSIMETKKDNWIEETLKSSDGLKRVPVSAELKKRLSEIPQNVRIYDRIIPMKAVWLTAASIALLVTVNIATVSKIKKAANQENTSIYSDYFSYIEQI